MSLVLDLSSFWILRPIWWLSRLAWKPRARSNWPADICRHSDSRPAETNGKEKKKKKRVNSTGPLNNNEGDNISTENGDGNSPRFRLLVAWCCPSSTGNRTCAEERTDTGRSACLPTALGTACTWAWPCWSQPRPRPPTRWSAVRRLAARAAPSAHRFPSTGPARHRRHQRHCPVEPPRFGRHRHRWYRRWP